MIRDVARLERLSVQARQGSDQPPAALLPLLQNPLAGPTLQQAERRCAEMRATPQSGQRDAHLHWLTVALYNAYTGPANAIRQRALIETAIELIGDPARRAILTGMLARNAARATELDAAWSWVARMDPASESLVADNLPG